MSQEKETEAFQFQARLEPRNRVPVVAVVAGASAGMVFALDQSEHTVGRSEQVDVRLSDPGISRNHCRIMLRGNQLELEDLGSTNGTLVEGRPLEGSHPLQEGERIQLGPVAVLQFGYQDLSQIELAVRQHSWSSQDALTFCLNRRHFDIEGEREDALTRRQGSTYCVLLCNIDGFAKLNQEHGPDQGDAILRSVSARIRGAGRPEDLLARFEADQFALLLRGQDVKETRGLAARIGRMVSATPIEVPAGSLKLRMSFGLADRASFQSYAECLAGAEKAQQVAKECGGSRLVVAPRYDRAETIRM